MTAHTVTVVINGTTYTRTTDRDYPHATFVRGAVRFHQTFDAARNRVGKSGQVFTTSDAFAAPVRTSCVVCAGDPRGVPSTSAIDGSVSWIACWGNAHKA